MIHFHSFDMFENKILFRIKAISEQIKNMAKAYLPMIIEKASNLPEHLIYEALKQKYTKKFSNTTP